MLQDEKSSVLFHAGCRACGDNGTVEGGPRYGLACSKKPVWISAILGEQEQCCGGRAYQMGYKEDFLQTGQKDY